MVFCGRRRWGVDTTGAARGGADHQEAKRSPGGGEIATRRRGRQPSALAAITRRSLSARAAPPKGELTWRSGAFLRGPASPSLLSLTPPSACRVPPGVSCLLTCATSCAQCLASTHSSISYQRPRRSPSLCAPTVSFPIPHRSPPSRIRLLWLLRTLLSTASLAASHSPLPGFSGRTHLLRFCRTRRPPAPLRTHPPRYPPPFRRVPVCRSRRSCQDGGNHEKHDASAWSEGHGDVGTSALWLWAARRMWVNAGRKVRKPRRSAGWVGLWVCGRMLGAG